MNSEIETLDARAAELRRALVATADLTPYTRRRPSKPLVIGAIVAFAVAGALTGGGVAAATSVNASQQAVEQSLAAQGRELIAEQNGKAVGLPIFRVGSGTTTIPLGARPAGANFLFESFECLDPADFDESIDGTSTGGDICSKDHGGGTSVGANPLRTDGAHTYGVKAGGSARFAVWLTWAYLPKLLPSAEQTAQLAHTPITHADEAAAYERYLVCMAALGYNPGAIPTTTLTPQYTVGGGAVESGADNRCYVTQYGSVDSAWQLEVEQTDIAKASLDACAKSNGLKPAATAQAIIDELNTQNLNWQACDWIG
jgi:hypothetical protein